MKPIEQALRAVAVAASLVTCGGAWAQTIELKFADQVPVGHVASKEGNQIFMKMVEAAAKGRVKFSHFPQQQLAKPEGMLDAVRNRIADIALVGVVYVSDRMPLTGAIELPGTFDSVVKGHAALEKLVRNELMPHFLGMNVRPLWAMTTAPFQLVMKRPAPVTGAADLAGVKLRTAGATAQLVAKALGATPVTIATPELYQSLERGIVDGAIFTLSVVKSWKLDEVAQSFTTNAELGSVAFVVLINENVWKTIPADIQAIMTDAGLKTGAHLARAIQVTEDSEIARLKAAGKTVYELSPAARAELGQKLASVQGTWLAQMRQRNLPGEQILEAYKRYLKE